MEFPTLYHIDSKGKTRTWRMEVDGKGSYRSISGVLDGNLVTSEWKKATPKNKGKANATTAVEQAILEVQSQYTKKRDRKYHDTLEDVGSYKFINPMLATSYKDVKTIKYPVYCQPKLDGIRAIVSRDSIMSRQGKPIVSCPHILRELSPFFEKHPDAILDGELYNHSLRDDFNTITSLVKQLKPTPEDLQKSEDMIEYHVYDVVNPTTDFAGRDIFITYDLPPTKSVKKVETFIAMSEHWLDDHFKGCVADGYEGQMIRLPNHKYEHKRSKSLIKRKEFFDAEYEVISIEEGIGNWAGYAKTVKCKMPDGKTFGAGIKGTQAEMKALIEKVRTGYLPKLATVRSPNMTPDGIPRFGIAVAFWDKERDY